MTDDAQRLSAFRSLVFTGVAKARAHSITCKEHEGAVEWRVLWPGYARGERALPVYELTLRCSVFGVRSRTVWSGDSVERLFDAAVVDVCRWIDDIGRLATEKAERGKPRALVNNGDGTFSVPLTHGRSAIIDSIDVELVGAHNWSASCSGGSGRWYASTTVVASGRRKCIKMHRLIAGAEGLEIDHVNGDGLDNRRANIRPATHSQNQRNKGRTRANSSGFKGVSWYSKIEKWRARITVHGKPLLLGNFDTPEAAHAAYCEAAKRLHGEFARTA